MFAIRILATCGLSCETTNVATDNSAYWYRIACGRAL
jgi:hypothetical protein